MDNKRKNQRLDCLVPVEGKTGGVFDSTQTTDISKGGIGIVSRNKIPVGQEIPIELDLEEDGKPVFVIGKVKWVRRIKDSEFYRIGLTFQNVLFGSKTRLNDYFKAS